MHVYLADRLHKKHSKKEFSDSSVNLYGTTSLAGGFTVQKTTELTVVYFLAAIFVASVLALFAMLVIIVAIK